MGAVSNLFLFFFFFVVVVNVVSVLPPTDVATEDILFQAYGVDLECNPSKISV